MSILIEAEQSSTRQNKCQLSLTIHLGKIYELGTLKVKEIFVEMDDQGKLSMKIRRNIYIDRALDTTITSRYYNHLSIQGQSSTLRKDQIKNESWEMSLPVEVSLQKQTTECHYKASPVQNSSQDPHMHVKPETWTLAMQQEEQIEVFRKEHGAR